MILDHAQVFLLERSRDVKVKRILALVKGQIGPMSPK